MKLFQKLKNKRGTTLVEVLVVVAIMAAMLGIAAPNLIAESRAIKLASMNNNARAVAVAAQSKMYGIKNAGTAVDSEWWLINNAVAETRELEVDGKNESVSVISNFGEKGEDGKRYLLSPALTESDLLQKGFIVVVYKPETADVIEVFYAESQFNCDYLFPQVDENFLESNCIGLYRGDGAPTPKRNSGLPSFSCVWGYDDEFYLEMSMTSSPDTELLYTHLGLEIYAVLPTEGGKEEEMLIYAEGIFDDDYFTTYAGNIKADYSLNPVTLSKISTNSNKLIFALDSLVTQSADYGKMNDNLRHQTSPSVVSAVNGLLYPRDSLSTWFNSLQNPYITFWSRQNKVTGGRLYDLTHRNAPATEYVGIDQSMRLRVKLGVLSEQAVAVESDSEGVNNGAHVHEFDDNYTPVDILTDNVSPYFYALANDTNTVNISSLRDFNNLKYIFETNNSIEKAVLERDITSQQFYDKLVKVRYALIEKDPSVNKDVWPNSANADFLGVDQIRYADGKANGHSGFTITGKDAKTGGRYAIENVQTGGADWNRGGIIEYAKNITVEDLDIVNPKIWKISYKANFIETGDTGKITGINVSWDNSVSGGLFGVAENCTFTNVHCYNDGAQNFKQEPYTAESYQPETWVPSSMAARYISGSVAGGLVGIAIGTEGNTTTFENCSASTQINSYYYGAMAQCVYAGGLVGIAMGNVDIKNSYAACQLSGYYSGGLVGAVAEGPFMYKVHYRDGSWSDDGWHEGQWEAEYNEGVRGTLTIENSFAAGHIQRQTMVGGGLIAQTNGVNVTVKNCYSAATWEILPPVAYGTFEGDVDNYYLVQNEINVPITLNTEARFKRKTGDVFSLNKGNHGIAVTETTLKDKFETGWKDATRTLQWWNKGNNGVPTFYLATDASGTGDKSTAYPFPMPSGNTKFWGDWNKDNANDISAANFAASLDGFYCVYFYRGDDGYQRFIDAASVHELQFDFSDTDITLPRFNITIKDPVTGPQDIWWASNENADRGDVAAFGTGVAGMTKVTASGAKVTFTGAAYYNSKYNPTKGYVDIDKFNSDSNDRTSRYLNWDYYGWYVSNGLFRLGYLAPSEDDKLALVGDAFSVEKETFENAIGYDSFTFNKDSAALSYDKGYFHVVEEN